MKKKKLFILISLIILLVLSFAIRKTHAEAPDISKAQRYEQDITTWLDKLQKAESESNPMMVILDSNNRYSYGCLQYQMDTWIGDSRTYHIRGEMMDCSKQRQLARLTVENEPKDGWRRWYNSVAKRGVGMPPAMPQQEPL